MDGCVFFHWEGICNEYKVKSVLNTSVIARTIYSILYERRTYHDFPQYQNIMILPSNNDVKNHFKPEDSRRLLDARRRMDNQMSSSDINQTEAEYLFELEKHPTTEETFTLTETGESFRIPLESDDGHEAFWLDVHQHAFRVGKHTFNNRVRTTIILARLDLNGPPHRNPDGEEIPCPHLHTYREGFGDKWAKPLPERFLTLKGHWEILQEFTKYCNIIGTEELIEKGLL